MNEFEMTAIALLRNIVDELKKLNAAAARRAAASGGATVADDRELDSQYGDETVRLNPRDWNGEPIKGLAMSECPPDALDELAKACDYFAMKNEGKKTDDGKNKSDFDRRTARRARGWAARLRGGWKRPGMDGSEASADDFGTDGFGGNDAEPF